MEAMFQVIGLIASTWLTFALLQLVALPVLHLIFGSRLSDRGWGFGRLVGWLGLSVVVWVAGHLGLAANTSQFTLFVFMFALAFSSISLMDNKRSLVEMIKSHWPLILTQEILFALGLVVMTFIRSFGPNVLDLEKFMDVGLMQSYLVEPNLPLEDMWLAGEKVNYYTFGHFMGAIATRLLRLESQVAYNLILGVIAGLLLSESFSLIANLIKLTRPKETKHQLRGLINAGVLGSLALGVGGNFHAAWYWLKHQSFDKYWYPDATRFIERTIHEFPAYSFIVSDLHAHVWSMPVVLLTLALAMVWLSQLFEVRWGRELSWQDIRESRFFLTASILGVTLGIAIMTSTWDFMVYGLFLSVLSLLLLVTDFSVNLLFKLVLSALVMIFWALATSSLWLINFTSISQGIKIASEHSPLWQLAVLWGAHVVVSLAALVVVVRRLLQSGRSLFKKPQTKFYLFVAALVLTAFSLLALPELIYFKDIYPNHPRANTMFKLTFQAFILMSLSFGWLVSRIKSEQLSLGWKIALGVLVIAFSISVGAYPYHGFRTYYANFSRFQGLDGLSWMREDQPGDYQVVDYLRQNVVGRPVITEAVGESYTRSARISTFTGLPTVLGWRVHEWLWRGGFDVPAQRTKEVRMIYEQPQSEEARRLLDKYQVQYVIVGELERETYQELDLPGLVELGKPILVSGETVLIEVDD